MWAFTGTAGVPGIPLRRMGYENYRNPDRGVYNVPAGGMSISPTCESPERTLSERPWRL